MPDNFDRQVAGATKDSNYTRKYAKEGVYPEAARSTSQKAVSNNISGQYPWYGEFSGVQSKPSPAIQRAYEIFMRQSEFKKPYKPGGYTEMETDADPPPGLSFDIPGPRPGVPTVDEPIVPPGEAPITIIFDAILDKDYEYGGFCRGNTTVIRVRTTEPCYSITVTYADPGTVCTLVGGAGTNEIYVQIDADNNQFAYITIYFNMRSVEGVSGASNVNVMPRVCEEYYVMRVRYGLVDKVTVWAMSEGAVATNIPDNAGTGTVSFPADYSEIANWLANSAPLAEALLVNSVAPAWEDTSLVIHTPVEPDYGNSCSASENSYVGGSWPVVDENDSDTADVSNVDDCLGGVVTNTDSYFWEYRKSVNCPAGTTKDDPFIHIKYSQEDRDRQGQSLAGQYESNTTIPSTHVFRTHASSDIYTYWNENADYTMIPNPTPPPATIPTDLGAGSYTGIIDFQYDVFSPLDNQPMIEIEHYASILESWTKTFALNGTVTGFTRTFTGVGIPRNNYAKVAAYGYNQTLRTGSVYGRHSAIWYFIYEGLKVSASSNYAGGNAGVTGFNSWESNANWNVVDEDIYSEVHAMASYTEEFADQLDLCTVTRDLDFEDAIKDLWDEFRTDRGIASDDLVETSQVIIESTIVL